VLMQNISMTRYPSCHPTNSVKALSRRGQ